MSFVAKDRAYVYVSYHVYDQLLCNCCRQTMAKDFVCVCVCVCLKQLLRSSLPLAHTRVSNSTRGGKAAALDALYKRVSGAREACGLPDESTD